MRRTLGHIRVHRAHRSYLAHFRIMEERVPGTNTVIPIGVRSYWYRVLNTRAEAYGKARIPLFDDKPPENACWAGDKRDPEPALPATTASGFDCSLGHVPKE